MSPRAKTSSQLACMQCFKSKCKCVARPDGDGCERCHRLKRPCRSSGPLRKSVNAERRQNSVARIGDLEGKIDSLVKLHCLLAKSPALSAALYSAVRDDDTLADYEHLLPPDDQDSASSTAETATREEDETIMRSSKATSVDPLDSVSSHTHEAEKCLATFREKMLPSFSFIDVPPDVTAQQLQRSHPFLLRSIIAVASPSKERKVEYGRELKQILAQTVLVENQSSLDLLQGVLTFTAWSHDQIWNPSGTLSRLMVMAISLACDLRMDKPLPPDEYMIKSMVNHSGREDVNSNQWFVADEQRAVLACFTLSSMISTYFAQIDPLKWKPRMDESLRIIEANEARPADAVFASQVRLQLLIQKAVQMREQQEWDSVRIGFEPGPSLSANLYIRTLQAQLHQLGNSFPATLRIQGTLMMHMHYAELCMCESARTSYPHPVQGLTLGIGPPSDIDDISTSNSHTLSFDRLDFAWRSVRSIKAWLDVFFSLSTGECAGLSFLHLAQLSRCLVVLYRLSIFTYPGWDCHAVRGTEDVLLVLDSVADKLKLAGIEVGEQSPDDLFMRISGMMRNFRNNAAAKVNQTMTSSVNAGGWHATGEVIGPSVSAGDPAAIANPTLLQSMGTGDQAVLDGIFGGFGSGWSV